MESSSRTDDAISTAARLSKNLTFRDKSVKSLQYTSRMLLGYYKTDISTAAKTTLQTVAVSQCVDAMQDRQIEDLSFCLLFHC